jgi:hypothetical protein
MTVPPTPDPAPTPAPSEPPPAPGPLATGRDVTLASVYIGVLAIVFIANLAQLLGQPASPCPSASGRAAADSVAARAVPSRADSTTAGLVCADPRPRWSLWPLSRGLEEDVRTLLVAVFAGAIGALIHAIRSLYAYYGEGQLRKRWLAMYYLLPFKGMLVAVATYLAIRAGLLTVQVQPTGSLVYVYAGVACLVGTFSGQTMVKLKEVAEALFAKVPPGDSALVTKPAEKAGEGGEKAGGGD